MREEDSWRDAPSEANTTPNASMKGTPRGTVEAAAPSAVVLATPEPENKRNQRPSGLIKSAEMGEEDGEQPLPTTICGTFSCHGLDEGKGKANQDCACYSYPLKNDNEAALFVVLDGHGDTGDLVSNELLSQVANRLVADHWKKEEAELTAQFVKAFEEAHHHMLTFQVDPATGMAPAQQSGAVGVAMVLRHGKACLAWAGDCRAIMGTADDAGQLVCVELTHDHKLEDGGEEQHRIEATGAFIRPTQEEPYFSPARVYADRTNPRKGPGLTMSRSLGDIDADACGVIPTPECTYRTLQKGKDKFIVMASDGLWEFLSSENVCEIVGGFLERGEDAIQATRFLIAKAAMAWRVEEGDYRDDITVIVLYLHDLPSALAPTS